MNGNVVGGGNYRIISLRKANQREIRKSQQK